MIQDDLYGIYDDLFNATDDYWAWNFQFILFQFDFPVVESSMISTRFWKNYFQQMMFMIFLFVIKMVKISDCSCFLTFKLVWSNFVIYNHCFLNYFLGCLVIIVSLLTSCIRSCKVSLVCMLCLNLNQIATHSFVLGRWGVLGSVQKYLRGNGHGTEP